MCIALAALSLLLTAPASAGRLAVRCGRLIDGVSDLPRSGALVLIEDGRIRSIVDGGAAPPDAELLDLSGYTVLPGLIDMHVHLLDGPEDLADLRVHLSRTREEVLRLGRKNAEATLLAGFTTVRNLGTYQPWLDRELRDDISAGRARGPRMLIAGYYLTIPGGGGDLQPPGVPGDKVPPALRRGIARGPRTFRRKAKAALREGADLLKVIASGSVLAFGSEPGAPEMTDAELSAVAEAAHAAGKKLAAHAHGARSIVSALLAGADTIEHASLIDAEGIRLAALRKTALSMDVYNGDYIDVEGRKAGWPKEFLEKNLATTQAQRDGFAAAYRAGAPIVFGTDAGVYPHGLNARQFQVMARLGMAPMDALRSATSVAARYLGRESDVGAVLPGRFGDLIAVKGDPLADLSILESIPVVIQGGTVVKRPVP